MTRVEVLGPVLGVAERSVSFAAPLVLGSSDFDGVFGEEMSVGSVLAWPGDLESLVVFVVVS